MTRASWEHRAATREFLRTTSPELLGYFERRVRPREDAADLLSETLIVAWRRMHTLPVDDLDRRRAWIYKVAANVLSNHRRTLRRRNALVDALRTNIAASHDQGHEASHSVRDAVERLPGKHRELIRLVHWDGLTLNEAADVLNLNPSTARSRYASAKEALREALGTSHGVTESALGHDGEGLLCSDAGQGPLASRAGGASGSTAAISPPERP